MCIRDSFKAFPDVPINIEIKGTNDADVASFKRTGALLADYLAKEARCDIIVGSFNDAALADFHQRAPQVPMSAALHPLFPSFRPGPPLPLGTGAPPVPGPASRCWPPGGWGPAPGSRWPGG